MRTNTKKLESTVWSWLAAGLVLGAMTACAYSRSLYSPRDKIVSFQLSKKPAQRAEQLALLGKLDVLGKTEAHHVYDVRVSDDEIKMLIDAGVDVGNPLPADKQKLLNEAQIEKYKTPEEIIATLKEIAAAQPDLGVYEEIGRTTEGRPLGALTLSWDIKNSSTKPVVVLDGMHHARELLTSEVVLDAAQTFALHWQTDPELKTWLEKYRIVFIPQVNPDGNVRVRQVDPLWRKNAGLANGKVVGVDLNRNYPASWNECNGSSDEPSSLVYRGPAEASEPETQALIQFLERTQPVAGISYHSYGGQVLLPPGCANAVNDDSNVYYELAYSVRNGITDDKGRLGTYVVGRSSDILYPVDGTSTEWAWKKLGTYALTVEVGSNGFLPNYTKWRDVSVQRQQGGWRGLLKFAERRQVKISFSQDLMNSQETLCDAVIQKRLNHNGVLNTLLAPGDYNCSFSDDGWLTYQAFDFSVPDGGKDFGTVTRADTRFVSPTTSPVTPKNAFFYTAH